MASAIVVDELTKTFLGGGGLRTCFRRRQPAEVLRGVSLTVAAGEIVGLLGPNGAGKTTLLAILATYLLPTSGRAWVCGHNVERAALAVRRAVGYCPAGARGFSPQLSGRQNLAFFARLTALHPRQARARVDELWTLVGLAVYRDLPVARYSEGMRQRLALARALLTAPPVLLLDEPLRSVDAPTAVAWQRMFREELAGKRGMAVLLVTHQLSEAAALCDRLAFMVQGRIVWAGRPEEVLDHGAAPGLALSLLDQARGERRDA